MSIRSMLPPLFARRPRRDEAGRTRRGGFEVETLEGRALLSLSYATYPIPDTPGLAVNQIVTGPNGDLWFTQIPSSFDPLNPAPPQGVVGELSPTGAVTIFPLPANVGTGSITAGPDGNMWFIEDTGTRISPPPTGILANPYTVTTSLVRITPSGVMTSFALPATLQPDNGAFALSLLAGPDGNLWIVEAGQVVKVTTTGHVTVLNVASSATDVFQSPVFGPDGNLWVGNDVDFKHPEIDRITPDGAILRFPMPPQVTTSPYDLVDGPDGQVWFLSNGVQALIGKISATGVVVTYPTPNGLNIGALTSSPVNNHLWFTATTYPVLFHLNPLQIGSIATDGAISVEPAQSPSITGNGPITFGPGGNLWFLETTAITPNNSLTPQAIVEAVFAPLTVTTVTRVNPVNQAGSNVVLTFSGPVDPSNANDPANYALDVVRATRHGFVGVRSIAIRSAVYDATAEAVTLRLARRLGPRIHYQLVVNAQGSNGLASTEGEHLSGAGIGLPGTNFRSLVPRVARRHPVRRFPAFHPCLPGRVNLSLLYAERRQILADLTAERRR